jgi:hypothetical protein
MKSSRYAISPQVQIQVEQHQATLVQENHMIVILPFRSYVWEVDSYSSAPLNIGLCGESWAEIAMTRLQMWYGTTASTKVAVDIQAILRSE